MDAETRDLFESSLLRLAKDRAREGRLPSFDATGSRKNPFCGDEVTVDLRLSAGVLTELGYEARACSLCVASAELLAQWAALGPDLDALLAREQAVKALLRGEAPPPEGLEALASVAPFRARHKCVSLPWEAAVEAVRAVDTVDTGDTGDTVDTGDTAETRAAKQGQDG